MKTTDYSKLAPKYDENRDRLNIPIDRTLESLLNDRKKVRVLDLACGTGNNLKVQSDYFGTSDVEWYGVDLSPAMLDLARPKVPKAHLSIGNAEELDFDVDSFDYITCNFAFHHFGNKARVLESIQRLLGKGGAFKMRNVVPECMTKWWVYNYCPEAYFQDLHRFWSKDLLVFELENRGFRTSVSVAYEAKRRSLQTILSEYIRRDNSQLAIASEKSYTSGRDRLQREISLGMTETISEFALLEIEAWAQ